MKLLLTSAGLMNQSIVDALLTLAGKPAHELKIAFIPTAMNVEAGDKSWFIKDLQLLSDLHPKLIDIVDISALPANIWQERLAGVDVLCFSGGNTFHLMHWMETSGFNKLVSEYFQAKVWVGISAGSMVTNPGIELSSEDSRIYYEEKFGYNNSTGLGLVDFYIRPHFNSPHFPKANRENIGKIASTIPGKIYALDDQSAVLVDGDRIEVVSEGEFEVFN